MLKEKFMALVTKLTSMNDTDLLDSVNYTIESCGQYVEAVNSMESTMLVLKFRLDANEYRERLIDADTRRRNIHNGLIANVTILNRICKMADVSPIFEGSIESRIEIAEFAMQVVNEMFNDRIL